MLLTVAFAATSPLGLSFLVQAASAVANIAMVIILFMALSVIVFVACAYDEHASANIRIVLFVRK